MAETLADLLAVLAPLSPALIVPDARHTGSQCPECGVQTKLSPNGLPTYCYLCTCDDLGFNAYDMAVCWAHKISMKQWRQYESEDQLPSVRYSVWRKRLGK